MTDTTASPPEVAPEDRRRLRWALVIISIAQLLVVLDSTIANIALPFIGRDLDIGANNLQWIVTGYALAFGGLLLLGGRLSDLYGRRLVFIVGIVVFVTASLVGGIAQNEAMLLIARGFQGFGAALASPAALALITTTFPAGPERNRAFAVYAAMSGAGAAVGLLLGGWLTGLDQPLGMSGWRLTFLIVVPIGLAAAFFAPRFFEESERHTGQLDVPGAITGTLGLLGIVYGLSRAGDSRYGWGETWTLASLVAGVLLLVVFAVIESRVEHPLLPIRIFASQTRAASFLAMALMPAAMFAMFFFLSLFVQNVMGYSPLKTGVAFLPFSFGIVLSATVVSGLVSRVDARYIAGVGTLISSAALFGFSRLSVPDGASDVLASVGSGEALGAGVSYWTDILPFVVLMALGMGAVFVPLTLTAVHHLRAEDSGIGSGVLNTMQQVGGALGLATLSTVATSAMTTRAEEIGPGIGQGLQQAAQQDPSLLDRLMTAFSVDSVDAVVGQLAGLGAFPEGATSAFFVGSFMMLAGSVVVWLFLDVKHEELATDGPEGVHVG
ncbi:MFS transporter [uncultured Nocardioides sp.]|uniref:MFS transporter n=1 Tax=uncultured Nocardioides sp. TaxID=198441 RepID=UPI0025FE2297|nr:MFS transporter [uncultured Nocardioides sp.]